MWKGRDPGDSTVSDQPALRLTVTLTELAVALSPNVLSHSSSAEGLHNSAGNVVNSYQYMITHLKRRRGGMARKAEQWKWRGVRVAKKYVCVSIKSSVNSAFSACFQRQRNLLQTPRHSPVSPQSHVATILFFFFLLYGEKLFCRSWHWVASSCHRCHFTPNGYTPSSFLLSTASCTASASL